MTDIISPEDQHRRFIAAVTALGGQANTARVLGVTDRTVRDLVSGKRAIHTGFLRDIAGALLGHAEYCRQLERDLTPLMHKNLTEAQRNERPDARRARADAEPANG